MPIPTDEQRLERRLKSQFQKAMTQYHLIEDGDKILVALSGGKDSLFLLEMLGKRAKIQRPHFEVEAIHVRMENIAYESDTKYLEDFAQSVGVPLHVVTTAFDPTVNPRKPACFLCSWNRRKQIFNLAQQIGCNKIALGHHQDDIIHTALMNLSFQGHFSTMPALLRMKKMPLALIRPLCLCQETDIKTYAERHNYQKQRKLCPYEKDTKRAEIADLYKQMESINPEARYSIWNALEAEEKLTEY